MQHPQYASLLYAPPRPGICYVCGTKIPPGKPRLRVTFPVNRHQHLCVPCAEALADDGCAPVIDKLTILRRIEAGRLDPLATCHARVVPSLEAREGRTCAFSGQPIRQGDPCVITTDWNGKPTHYTMSGAEGHARDVDCDYIFAALTRYRHRQGR